MGRKTDKEHLADLFAQPCECIRTSGVQDGIILKFRSFYLKIYDAESGNSYIVMGYRYHEQSPMFTDNVKESEMRRYAAQF